MEKAQSKSPPGKFYSETKIVKLKNHPRNFSEEDLIVNLEFFAREKFQLFEGIVIEIFPLEERNTQNNRQNHLLLELKNLPQDVQSKGGPISISQEVAHAFNLSNVREVCIRRVDKKMVGLDLVEFRFKDQALSRSDMWRFTNSLIDKGMYVSRKIQFAGMLMRVSGLWAGGSNVKSGAVIETTRVVFRSASSKMIILLQVSSEMWDFDPSGDTYCDKAIDGFLKDLFRKWKEKECNHEVSIILFARKYSDKDNGGCSMKDTKRGKCYNDFYKVIIESDRRSDWSSCTVDVKKCLQKFQKHLVPIPQTPPSSIKGKEYVSGSCDGNVLEALNLAINIYENCYKDASFATTGQQVVILSPGVGVYEVDQDLNRITKERVIDYGIGVDLVCLNEQPLHAVPLFKPRDSGIQDERYYIPHWINYSFYSPRKPWNMFGYQPRIKVSDHLINRHLKVNLSSTTNPQQHISSALTAELKTTPTHNLHDPLSRVDYDSYDADIFTSPGAWSPSHSTVRGMGTKRKKAHSYSEDISSSVNEHAYISTHNDPDSSPDNIFEPKLPRANNKYNATHEEDLQDMTKMSRDILPSSYKETQRTRHHSDNYDGYDHDVTETLMVAKVSSAENVTSNVHTSAIIRRRKALINPFDPSKVHIDMASHQCRWMHIFPRDTAGRPFQAHHKLEKLDENRELSIGQYATPTTSSVQSTQSVSHNSSGDKNTIERFASARRAGLDWTSITEPACLPITTDFFPDNSTLSRDYLEYHSALIVNSYNEEEESHVVRGWRCDHQYVSTIQAFKEMISQRLSQGFQLVFEGGNLFLLHKEFKEIEDVALGRSRKAMPNDITLKFSLGRVFQCIQLSYPDIKTYIYRSKNTLGVKPYNYNYQLISNDDVISCHCCVTLSKLEAYNWNYLDQHVCGHSDFEEYQESHKYWRCRYSLLPATPPPKDGSKDKKRQWHNESVNNFVRFLETLNHMKRTSASVTASLSSRTGSYTHLSSLPVRPGSSYRSSRSPSPTLTPAATRDYNASTPLHHTPLHHMDHRTPAQRPYATSISLTEPRPSRTRSREDIYGDRQNQSFHTTSPRHSPFYTMRQRSGREIVGDLAKLTMHDKDRPRSVSPGPYLQSPGPHLQRRQSYAVTTRALEDDDGYPSLTIVPSTPINLRQRSSLDDESEKEIESSLDLPVNEPFTVHSPLPLILQALINKDEGVDTVSEHNEGLRPGCFVAMEAVSWLIENFEEQTSRDQVVEVLQKMVEEGRIAHASGNRRIPFVDGYYLYYAISVQNEEECWDSYRKRWYEVAVMQPTEYGSYHGTYSHGSSLPASGSSPYYMSTTEDKVRDRAPPPDFFSRYVELNPDVQGTSDRVEWVYVRYSNTYDPFLTFDVEFQWMVATMSILYTLIQGWVYKASMCNFNLVPLPSILGDRSCDPFLQPESIPLSPEYLTVVRESGCSVYEFIMHLLQAVLDKFGFVVDSSSVPTDVSLSDLSAVSLAPSPTGRVYVHYSGCVMVQPTYDESGSGLLTAGFNWYKNHYFLKQKTTPTSVLVKYEELHQSMFDLCHSVAGLTSLGSSVIMEYFSDTNTVSSNV